MQTADATSRAGSRTALRPRATWRDPRLGEPRELDLQHGRLRYFDVGAGEAIFFVHGAFVNANVWRKLFPLLSPTFRCVAPDLPFGSHALAMRRDADLSERGIVSLIADAIEALGLEDVILVGMDTGGAVCQFAVTQRPERIGRLVLCSCDYRDNFPPRRFYHLKLLPYIWPVAPFVFAPFRLRAVRRAPNGFGPLTKRPVERAVEDSWALPSLESRAIARDVAKACRIFDKRRLNETADRLRAFERPALIAWSADDKVFPPSHARALADDLPNARLAWIDDSRTLSMEEQPEALADAIAEFVRDTVEPAAERGSLDGLDGL
jgi:pimeloyl-ACP methyl ester carboxylesterase